MWHDTHDRCCNNSCLVGCILYILKTFSTRSFAVQRSLRIGRLLEHTFLGRKEHRRGSHNFRFERSDFSHEGERTISRTVRRLKMSSKERRQETAFRCASRVHAPLSAMLLVFERLGEHILKLAHDFVQQPAKALHLVTWNDPASASFKSDNDVFALSRRVQALADIMIHAVSFRRGEPRW